MQDIEDKQRKTCFGKNQKASTEYESSRNNFTSNVFVYGLHR